MKLFEIMLNDNHDRNRMPFYNELSPEALFFIFNP